VPTIKWATVGDPFVAAFQMGPGFQRQALDGIGLAAPFRKVIECGDSEQDA